MWTRASLFDEGGPGESYYLSPGLVDPVGDN